MLQCRNWCRAFWVLRTAKTGRWTKCSVEHTRFIRHRGKRFLGSRRRLCDALPEIPAHHIIWCEMVSTIAAGYRIVFLIYHKLLSELVVYVENPPITFGASFLVVCPSYLILTAISKVQYLEWGDILIMSEVLVIVVSVLRFLPNETMSTLQWGGASAVISATFSEVVFYSSTDKPTSKKGETFLCAEIRPKILS